jgi:(p)ppGpp synthase/HD superfamily hydrolase
MVPFTPRIHEAIDFAARAHKPQTRKDPDRETPYVAHVFGVAYLIAEFGFDEDEVVAALLHDVLEDQPQDTTELERFGERVASLVRAVSEKKLDEEGHLREWEVRKREYIEHMRNAPEGAKAISCADKIHNMQSILLALDRGVDIWHDLNSTPGRQLLRFRRLREALSEGWSHPILERFDQIYAELERRAAAEQSSNA